MTIPASAATVDVRQVVPRERHPLIFSTFRKLAPGQAMVLVNDHDPKPLYDQFQAEAPGRFAWDCLESGPQTWRVSIAKLAAPHSDGSCCGSCGGS
jgi:uncharacterized protein (DUF2249 family)